MGSTPRLEPLTLDAVMAESIAHHLRNGAERSHFNPEVSALQRVATLGEQYSKVIVAAMGNPEVSDTYELQKALITLAATALIWTELLDKHGAHQIETSMPTSLGGVVGYYTEGELPSDVRTTRRVS